MTGWKGIVLAGGTGSRLYPLTEAMNKHLLPVYDKPLIYYPLTTLMLAGIREITVVTASDFVDPFRAMLGTGADWGLRITYQQQKRPDGVAGALAAAKLSANGCKVALILGDNIFYGANLGPMIEAWMDRNEGATIFTSIVADPSAFGVVELDPQGRPIAIEEKSSAPRSNHAVTGLYLFDERVHAIVDRLTPSKRSEFEITDVVRVYLEGGELAAVNLGRGIAWLDGGTPENLFRAGQLVNVIQERTGLYVASPEEIALRKGFIDEDAFARLVGAMPPSIYKSYLAAFAQGGV